MLVFCGRKNCPFINTDFENQVLFKSLSLGQGALLGRKSNNSQQAKQAEQGTWRRKEQCPFLP